MRSFRIDLLALVLCTFAAPALSADQFPAPPEDPRLAEAFTQARALLAKSLAPGYTDMPDTAKPWPCAVPDLEIRKLGGALSDEELKNLVPETKTLRRAAGNMKTSIRDVRYAPVSATCKDGKLDGPLEFVIEFTRVMDSFKYIMEAGYRMRISTRMKSGKPAAGAPNAQSTLQISQKTKFKNPAEEEQMAKHFLANPFKKSLSVNYAVPGKVGGMTDFYSVAINDNRSGGWMTILSRPTGPGRVASSMYDGAALSMTTSMKNYKSHGEFRIYETTPDGKSVLKSTQCYEDGEQIMTTDCKVD